MVIVVEDDPGSSTLIERALKLHGQQCEIYKTATEAWIHFRAKPSMYRLAVLDCMLPGGMNGIELAEHIQELSPELPIVFITGLYDPYNIARVKAMGAYIPKPTSVWQDFNDLLNKLL